MRNGVITTKSGLTIGKFVNQGVANLILFCTFKPSFSRFSGLYCQYAKALNPDKVEYLDDLWLKHDKRENNGKEEEDEEEMIDMKEMEYWVDKHLSELDAEGARKFLNMHAD